MKGLFFSLAVLVTASMTSFSIICTDELIESSSSKGVTVHQLTNSDVDFLTGVYNTNLFEISAAKLALQKSRNAKVKEFANKMMSDHTDMNTTTKSVAEKVMITLPQKMNDAELQGELTSLKALSGKSFDEKYIDINVKGHEGCLASFENVLNDVGYSAEVKQMVNDMMGTLKDHMTQANKLRDQIRNS